MVCVTSFFDFEIRGFLRWEGVHLGGAVKRKLRKWRAGTPWYFRTGTCSDASPQKARKDKKQVERAEVAKPDEDSV